MDSDTKLVIEILTPLIIMMGWMWKNLSKKTDANTKELQNLDRRIQRIEDRLEFSNKVLYVQQDDSKGN